MFFLIPIFWGAAALFPLKSYAYPGYIAYGYSSCLTCHFQPTGGGSINSYARAVQATEISGNLFNQSMENLERVSDFPFQSFSEKLDVQSSFRGLLLGRKITSSDRTFRWVTMQADLAARFQLSPQLQLIGSVGYVPLPASVAGNSDALPGELLSREHYLAYRPDKDWGMYAGFFDPVFGLRVPEHNAFIRANLLLNINDQTHGVLAHHSHTTGDFFLHLFSGNLYQHPSIRPRGFSSMVDFALGESARLGGSFWFSKSDFRERFMIAAHLRTKVATGSSLLLQTSLFRQRLRQQEVEIGTAEFAQLRLFLKKGVFTLITIEHFIPDFQFETTHLFRFGPTLEYLPFPKFELRGDFFASTFFNGRRSEPLNLNIQIQTHLWL